MAKGWLEINVRVADKLVENTLALFDDNVSAAVKQSGKIIKRRARNELEIRQHVAEHDLINSLEVEIEKSRTIGWLVSLTTLDIAANGLEYGTDPSADDGPVNVSNIIVWLEEKGIEPDYGTVEDYAYAIARNIGELGMTLHGIPIKGNQKRPFNAAQKKAKTEIESLWNSMISKFTKEFNKLG